MWYIWLILIGIFAVAEIITPGFLVIWLSASSFCGMITSFITDNVIIQTTVFVITSAIFICFTRPLAKKLSKKDKNIVTNAFSIVGKKSIVIQEINPTLGQGQIKVDGQVWSAKCQGDEIIPKDTEVTILAIDGVKAVVSSKTSQTEKVKETV